jgi:TetR/AcrR family transcriptional regulator, lmrAB and yxaGH operons repressor
MHVLVKLGREASMATDTRARMIEATVEALQRNGIAGMSFTDVLRSSGAARGAIYHHFPGGKSQLVAEAATRNGQDVRARLALLPTGSPQTVVESFLEAVRPVVRAAAEGCGCAVAAVTVGADQDELRQVAAGAFGSWVDQLAERLTTSGLGPQQAADLATSLVMLLEGAQVLCRASGDLGPFDRAARTARLLAQPDGGAQT